MAFTSLSNIAPFEILWIIRHLRNIILRNTRATIVLGGSQFIHYIPLSKREAKIKNQAGFFVFDKFTLQVNLGDESGVNRPFKHTFSHHVSRKQYYEALFYHTDLGQNLFFFALFEANSAVFYNFARKIALIQYPGRSKHALCLPLHNNYSIYHIIKRFHEENSVMLGLFS